MLLTVGNVIHNETHNGFAGSDSIKASELTQSSCAGKYKAVFPFLRKFLEGNLISPANCNVCVSVCACSFITLLNGVIIVAVTFPLGPAGLLYLMLSF